MRDSSWSSNPAMNRRLTNASRGPSNRAGEAITVAESQAASYSESSAVPRAVQRTDTCRPGRSRATTPVNSSRILKKNDTWVISD